MLHTVTPDANKKQYFLGAAIGTSDLLLALVTFEILARKKIL